MDEVEKDECDQIECSEDVYLDKDDDIDDEDTFILYDSDNLTCPCPDFVEKIEIKTFD